jgi:hypothetical protein
MHLEKQLSDWKLLRRAEPETWETCRRNNEELVSRRAALINLNGKSLLQDSQFVAKKTDFFLLGFEIVQILISQNEVQEYEPGTHEIEGVTLAIAKVVLIDLAVKGAREQMEDRTPAHVVPDSGVPALDHFLRKRCGTLPIRGFREGPKLAESEVSGMYGHDVEKVGFGVCVPKFLDPIDLSLGIFITIESPLPIHADPKSS